MIYNEFRPRFFAWDPTTWSVYVGQMFGIRIRLQITLLFLLAVMFLSALGQASVYWLATGVCVFTLVLLHEFGHCFACRAVGGEARDIIMHPLGGLALCRPPERPMAHLITTIGGPAVNFVLGALTIPVLVYYDAFSLQTLNPFAGYAESVAAFAKAGWWSVFFDINLFLFLFNLLPMLPLDGGRITEELLWFRMRHTRARILACNIGMTTAAVVIGLCLWFNTILGAVLPALCFFHCKQLKRITELTGGYQESEFGYDFSQGYTSLERSMGPEEPKPATRPKFSLFGWFWRWQERRRADREAKVEEEVDRILAKIHDHGIESLTRAERKLLTEASRHRQRR